jgi:hypothetical protein
MLTGKVSITITGFKKEFSKPITRAVTTVVCQLSRETPETILTTAISEMVLTSQRIKKFVIVPI